MTENRDRINNICHSRSQDCCNTMGCTKHTDSGVFVGALGVMDGSYGGEYFAEWQKASQNLQWISYLEKTFGHIFDCVTPRFENNR